MGPGVAPMPFDEGEEEAKEDASDASWTVLGGGAKTTRPLDGMLELGPKRRSLLMATCPMIFRIPEMADKPSVKMTSDMWKFVNDPETKPKYTDTADQIMRKFTKGTNLKGWMLQYSAYNGVDAMLRGTDCLGRCIVQPISTWHG